MLLVLTLIILISDLKLILIRDSEPGIC